MGMGSRHGFVTSTFQPRGGCSLGCHPSHRFYIFWKLLAVSSELHPLIQEYVRETTLSTPSMALQCNSPSTKLLSESLA